MAAISGDPTRSIQRVEHPTLIQFNNDFGTHSDLSRYESIRSAERATSPAVAFLNLLQMDSFIPTRIALLLKNNLHDLPFITHTTRSLLYELKQKGMIGEACFTFLHEKINKQDFLSVFRYLYIVMLYSKIASAHDAQITDPSFAFESVSRYSDKLIKTPTHLLAKEELQLQDQTRRQFLRSCLLEFATRPDFPREAQQQIFTTVRTLDENDPHKFRAQLMILLDKLEKLPELEKICWKELQTNISPYQGQEFFDQAYLRLKTENYYKNCLSRVTTLRESLDRTSDNNLLTLSEKCKKAYNGCIYLLGDSKNMAACSQTRFAALTGKMRTQWQSINNIFSRAQGHYAHNLCACQVQTPPNQHKLATWPFNSNTLIDLKPAEPLTPQQLQQQGISPTQFAENQKKTVAIIGCKWGGGHMEISRGIANNLSSHGYHPITVDLPEVLISEDPIRNSFITRWLGKDWSTATLFEGLIKAKAFALISFARWLKSKLFSSKGYSETELKLVTQQLLKLNPDSVIITYSAHNESVIQACKILGIPCIHVATDVDTTIETRDAPPDYNHFKMAIPFDAPETIDPILKTTTAAQRFVSGPPVRHAFTQQRTPADIQRFKEKWGIDTRKKVVVISSGKNGDSSQYPEILAERYAKANPSSIPIHLVVICGNKNHDFKRHLEQNVSPKTKLSMTVALSYKEDEMEELMSMASHGGVLVGKAGGGTVFETFTRGTRVLVDNVHPGMFAQGFHHFCVTFCEMVLRTFGFRKQLPWEKVNMDFAKKHGLAQIFKDESEFLPKLDRMLANDNLPVHLNVDVKNVEEEIPKMLRQMMAKAQVERDTRDAREVHRKL